MQRKVVTISADERVSTAEDIMTLGAVRHMPVVRAGALVGVVSERDLLRVSLSDLNAYGEAERKAFLHALEISAVMSESPVTIHPEASVEKAASVLAEQRIGCLPVVDDDQQLIGIVTQTDVLRHFGGGPH